MKRKWLWMLLTALILSLLFTTAVYATEPDPGAGTDAGDETVADTNPFPGLDIQINPGTQEQTASSVKIIVMLTVLALLPTLLIMMTGFVRILIVLGLTRNALGLQQMPPNQVLIGLALFLTFFVMAPAFNTIYEDAWKPYADGQIDQETAFEIGVAPLREFMFEQTYRSDMNLFIDLSHSERPQELTDIKTSVLIPAFLTSELKRAFQIGFLIYLPFLVIDMLVASVLMSMGMMMLPPVMVSMPLKIMLFVLAGGWQLIISGLVQSFG